VLQPDPRQGTGEITRWYSLLSLVKTHKFYPDRRQRDRLLTCYDSRPLDRDMEVTGHGIATLYVRTRASDGSFFVYLEEITADGRVCYVTEGGLRALHRRQSAQPEYRDVVPTRSFRLADAAPLVADEVTRLEFDLLPTSYLFRKGSRIRIALATVDADAFEAICPPDSAYEILRTAEYPSGVSLPVFDRG
jgi:putative CocE/NonD family hydrolase